MNKVITIITGDDLGKKFLYLRIIASILNKRDLRDPLDPSKPQYSQRLETFL